MGYKRRHKAGDEAQEVLDYLINNSVNNQDITTCLNSIIDTSNDEEYCHENDVDRDGNSLNLHDLDDYNPFSNK